METIQHVSFVNILLKDRSFFEKLFDGINTFPEFLKKIDKISNEYEEYSFADKYQFVGDLFEIFAEIFFILNETNPGIGICDYQPARKSSDYGVDGFGIGIDGKPATVQVKYRSNKSVELLSKDIKNFGMQSIVEYNVDKDTRTNMIVFTSAKGIHYITDEVYSKRLRIINYELISKIVNGNFCFWNAVKKLLKKSYTKYF